MWNKVLVFLLFTCLCSPLQGQNIAIGTWRSHLNYSHTKLLALYNYKVYATSAHGFFYYDLEDNSLHKLTKNDGFSDVGITALATIPENQGLIIGYESGAIDILQKNKISYIDLLKKTFENSPKSINDITFYNGLAYLSTGQGIVALNYETKEIQESYTNIGTGGSTLETTASVVSDDSIFAATPSGVIYTSISNANNLKDYHNWIRFSEAEGLPQTTVKDIALFNGAVYALMEGVGLFKYTGAYWEKLDFPEAAGLVQLRITTSNLIVITSSSLYKLENDGTFKNLGTGLVKAPSDIVETADKEYYVADQQLGLLPLSQNIAMGYYPSGPFSDMLQKLTYFDGKIVGINYGLDKNMLPLHIPATFSVFVEGQWQNYSSQTTPQLSGIQDFTDLAYNNENNMLYFTSWGAGVLAWNLNEDTFFDFNSTDENVPFSNDNIYAVGVDLEGKTWFSESAYASVLHSLSKDNKDWNSYNLGINSPILQILPIPYGDIWLRLPKGLLVFNTEEHSTTFLNTINKNIIADSVTIMTYDKNGLLWYGTSSGIAYIANINEALTGGAASIVPVYEDAPLFKNIKINSIAVDGGNRKWIATNEGAWLFGEDGEQLLEHFSENNSPLLSNLIYDIKIDENSGEVYFATEKGLVSYRSNATTGLTKHSNVKIFPNPVRHGYHGNIGISGLVESANVKITDMAGNLVKELNAEGGTATWDGNSLSGERVNTGIYLVFSSSANGDETYVGKLAFIQ